MQSAIEVPKSDSVVPCISQLYTNGSEVVRVGSSSTVTGCVMHAVSSVNLGMNTPNSSPYCWSAALAPVKHQLLWWSSCAPHTHMAKPSKTKSGPRARPREQHRQRIRYVGGSAGRWYYEDNVWKDGAGVEKVGMLSWRSANVCKEDWPIHHSIAEDCARWAGVQGNILAVLLCWLYHCFKALRCIEREESCIQHFPQHVCSLAHNRSCCR